MKKLKYPTYSFLFLLSFLILQSAKAYDFTLSIGNLCEYVGKIQTDNFGSTNLCALNPYLSSSMDYDINESLVFAPEIGFSIPKNGREDHINKMSLFALSNAKIKLSMFHFIGGMGFFITRISGSGGTEDLKNGNSTVSFPIPDSTFYSRNFIINLGFGVDFNKFWSADAHTYIFNLISNEDRAFSIALNGTYHFGEF